MTKQTLDFLVEKTHELINAPTCNSETRASAQRWLDAVGTAQQAAETSAYIAALEGDIMPIEQLIAFSQSEEGVAYFGADAAAGIAAHAKEIQQAGGRYCDCPACLAVAAILEKKSDIISA